MGSPYIPGNSPAAAAQAGRKCPPGGLPAPGTAGSGTHVPSGRHGTVAGNPGTGRLTRAWVFTLGNGRPRWHFSGTGAGNPDPWTFPDIAGPVRPPRFADRIAANQPQKSVRSCGRKDARISPCFRIFYFAIKPGARSVGGRIHMASSPRDFERLPPDVAPCRVAAKAPGNQEDSGVAMRPPGFTCVYDILLLGRGGKWRHWGACTSPQFPRRFRAPESRPCATENLDDPGVAADAPDVT